MPLVLPLSFRKESLLLWSPLQSFPVLLPLQLPSFPFFSCSLWVFQRTVFHIWCGSCLSCQYHWSAYHGGVKLSAFTDFILLVFDRKEKETVAICLKTQEVATETHQSPTYLKILVLQNQKYRSYFQQNPSFSKVDDFGFPFALDKIIFQTHYTFVVRVIHLETETTEGEERSSAHTQHAVWINHCNSV